MITGISTKHIKTKLTIKTLILNMNNKTNGRIPDGIFMQMMALEDKIIMSSISKESIDKMFSTTWVLKKEDAMLMEEFDNKYKDKLIYGTKGNE